MKSLSLALVFLFGSLLTGAVNAQQKTIAQTAIDAGNFDTLVTAVKAAGLVDTLNGHSELTVFAPTDEAFAQLDQATLRSLLKPENKSQLTQILTYHVIPGRVNAAAAYDLDSAGTVNGQRLPLDFRGEALKVGDSNIQVTDIQCSNGVIHVIDAVLMPKLASIPETAQAAGQFNTLLAAVGAAGLAEVLSGPGPFTVFAPTDDAFAALPEGTVESLLQPENKQQLIDILKFHVVSGRVYDNDAVKARRASTLLGRGVEITVSADGVKVNESRVVAKNIEASNGVIHVIDAVLLPKSMSNHEVMSILTNAIQQGVPVFNAGNHGQCSEIYMSAMTSILDSGIEHADEHTMTMLKQTIENARNTHSMTDRAWTLRRGMDALHSRMGQMNP